MEEDGRWVTMNGVHIFIKDGQSPMDAFIRNQTENKKTEKAKNLNNTEYEDLCKKFADSLTKEEKELINSYGVGGGYSSDLNDPSWRDVERTYRFSDNNKLGFKEEKMSFYEAVTNRELDYKATNIKTSDANKDDIIRWNYERATDAKKFFKDMDNIFEKKGISLDKDIILYRKGHESLENLQNGAVRYGYTSTSAKSRINKQTPGHLVLGSNEFEIIVPAGTKFLPIKNLVPDDVKFQNEILLPRNLKFSLIEDKSKPAKYNYEKFKFEKAKNKYLVKVQRS